MSVPTHPGKIVFVDQDAGTEQVKSADQVPASVAFASVEGSQVPVTRIVSSVRGDQRVIHSYDEGGRLLLSTVQVRAQRD